MNETSIIAELRAIGSKFAYLFGSKADGSARTDSDIDVAAWFGDSLTPQWERAAHLDSNLDLLVLDEGPLELAGRVAMYGRLLFDDDPPERVRWEATTRKIWLDERPRIDESRRIFLEGAKARGRR
ncbi:MAG: nucleotidyltransferase domain-containing protein [Actinomycetota bacterium]